MHPALLLVHPTFFKNAKTAPTFFLPLKVVFFKTTSTIFAYSCSRFSLFGAIFSSIPWQWLGAVKVKVPMFSVAVVVGGIRGTHLCWVCVVVYCRSCESSWSVIDLWIKLIRMLIFKTYVSTWSVILLRINLIRKWFFFLKL